jgi:S-formylglutathione hydrolase FrmB
LLAATLVLATGAVFVWHTLSRETDAERYGVRVLDFDLRSRLLHRELPEVAVQPLPRRRRPLLILLHGRDGSPASMLSDELLAALHEAGTSAPDVVFANGDDASYYHDRDSGPWGSYVVEELIPKAVHLLDADPLRVAIGGVSMGGFGALDIARLWPGRFCAAGGHSAAIFESGGESSAGSFDDAEDFARHDLFAVAKQRPGPYGRMPVWVDVGTEDPFREADTIFARRLRSGGAEVTFHVWPGGHDSSYWRGHMDEYVDFYVKSLSSCRR